MSKSVKGIFFDLYGTLLVFEDFDKANFDWVNTFYELIGRKNGMKFSVLEQICKEILETEIEKDFVNGFTTYETKIKKCFEMHGIVLSLKELKKIANATVETWQHNIRVAEDAFNVFNKLKKIKK